ncbi:MAG: hemerythrin family protein [Methylococcales bacterium]|nr:hemerythrin family protein [Methylococcales bacterium]
MKKNGDSLLVEVSLELFKTEKGDYIFCTVNEQESEGVTNLVDAVCDNHQLDQIKNLYGDGLCPFGLYGIEEIDDDHVYIISLMKRFKDVITIEIDKHYIDNQFDEIITNIALHFETEDEFMSQSGYSDKKLRQHRANHELFLANINREKMNYETENKLIDIHLFNFLLESFGSHVAEFDQLFSVYYLNK